MQTRVSRRSAFLLAFTSAAIALAPAALAQAPADAIIGKWEADDGSVRLDMYKTGAEYRAHLLYGNQVVEADNVTFKLDTLNPDPALRSRSLKNIVFMWGFRWQGNGWGGGSIYDGSSGSTYSCDIEIKGGKMLVRGYIGLPILGQTRSFHRSAG